MTIVIRTMKSLVLASVALTTLALNANSAQADVIYSYAYTGFDTPGYSGAPNYSDNLHGGTSGF